MKKIVLLFGACLTPLGLFGEDANVLKTRYIVIDKSNASEDRQGISSFIDFNDEVDKLYELLREQQDRQSVFSQYLIHRLEVMKAISERIAACFGKQLGKKENELISDKDISSNYKRNKSIDVEVSQSVRDLVEQLVPCDLFFGKESFAVLKKSLLGMFGMTYKYYIDEKSGLDVLNTYLAWVESLILATLVPVENFKKIDIIAPHLYSIYEVMSKNVTPQNYLLIKLRNEYITRHFLPLIEQAYDALYMLKDANLQDKPEIVQLMALSLTLQALLNYHDNEIRQIAEIENQAIASKLDALNHEIVDFGKSALQWNDGQIKQSIDSITDAFASWIKNENQLARFEKALEELQSQECISLDVLALLERTIVIFSYALQSQGGDNASYEKLLNKIELLRAGLPSLDDMLMSLVDLQRNLLLLSA